MVIDCSDTKGDINEMMSVFLASYRFTKNVTLSIVTLLLLQIGHSLKKFIKVFISFIPMLSAEKACHLYNGHRCSIMVPEK